MTITYKQRRDKLARKYANKIQVSPAISLKRDKCIKYLEGLLSHLNNVDIDHTMIDKTRLESFLECFHEVGTTTSTNNNDATKDSPRKTDVPRLSDIKNWRDKDNRSTARQQQNNQEHPTSSFEPDFVKENNQPALVTPVEKPGTKVPPTTPEREENDPKPPSPDTNLTQKLNDGVSTQTELAPGKANKAESGVEEASNTITATEAPTNNNNSGASTTKPTPQREQPPVEKIDECTFKPLIGKPFTTSDARTLRTRLHAINKSHMHEHILQHIKDSDIRDRVCKQYIPTCYFLDWFTRENVRMGNCGEFERFTEYLFSIKSLLPDIVAVPPHLGGSFTADMIQHKLTILMDHEFELRIPGTKYTFRQM